MSFEIHTSEDKAISIVDLDKEVAQLWGKEIREREYATPYPVGEGVRGILAQGTNWFDSVGYAIHSQGYYTSGWNNIKCTLWTIQSQDLYKVLYNEEQIVLRIEGIRLYLKPYFDLIDHWEGKGYKPLKVE